MDADLASRAVPATLSEKPFRAGALLVMKKGFLARALVGNRLNIACKRVRARILHEDAEFWVRDLGRHERLVTESVAVATELRTIICAVLVQVFDN